MNSTSVPKVLLGLGALCLLAASAIFLAVSWSTLGVGGRTAVLASLTLAALGASLGLHRAGLRMAAEALSVVTLGMLTLDVYGAAAAGLLGDLGHAQVTVLAGAVLVLGASALGVVTRPRLVTPQVASGVGLGLASIGGVLVADSQPLLVGNLAVAIATALAWWARRTGLPVQQVSCQIAALPAWLLAAATALGHGTSPSLVLTITIGATAAWAALAAARDDLRDVALVPAAAGTAQLGIGAIVVVVSDLFAWFSALPAFSARFLVHLSLPFTPIEPALVVPAVLVIGAVLAIAARYRPTVQVALLPLGAAAALAAAAYDVPLAVAVGLLVATAAAVVRRYPLVALALLGAAAIGALPSAGLTAAAAGIGLVLAATIALTSTDAAARVLSELAFVPLSALTIVGLIEQLAPGTHAAESFTLPLAAGLLAAGLVHLRRNPEAGSEVLLPGLLVAVVPSTLLVLGDPVSLRALLLGLGCLVLVLVGAGLRWASPVIVGAAAGTIVVLREMGPYASSVPQWVWIGLAGVLLTVAGITWERQLRDLRRAVTMVGRLR